MFHVTPTDHALLCAITTDIHRKEIWCIVPDLFKQIKITALNGVFFNPIIEWCQCFSTITTSAAISMPFLL
jgi:hypothetical protein